MRAEAMDCCNYMQYRHHQTSYYHGGPSQFYDPLPPPPTTYHPGDFYGQQIVYPDYYGGGGGNSPYYPQQWPCAPASFPDYVYNPKEARIRKAMRDATRERSIGASPMLPRPNARRAHSWVASHEELMMQQAPLQSMRSTVEPPPPPPPSCGGGGGFPLSSAGNGSPFMTGSGGGYTKLEPSHSPMSSAGPAHSNYMQSTNPLAQLQQHAEMWDAGYHQSSMCPKSPGNPYLMSDMSPYHHPSAQQEVIHNETMSIEEQQHQQQHPHLPSVHHLANNTPSMTPPQPPNGENLPSPAPPRQSKQEMAEKAHHHHHHHSPRSHHSAEMGVMGEEFETNSQTMMDQSGSTHQPSTGMDIPPNGQQEQQLQDHPSFMSVFGQQQNADNSPDNGGNVESGRSFEKIDEAAAAKMKKAKRSRAEDVLHLPLSSQSIRNSSKLFSNDPKFQTNYIQQYFENTPSMMLMNIATPNGFSFPYATYVPLNLTNSIDNEARVFANVSQPSFYYTDVGYIPMSSLLN